MYKAVAHYSYDCESWRIIIGIFADSMQAEKACYDYASKHEHDSALQYMQVLWQ
jgi:hypothetical protein